jgi:hypothetical protein
MIRTMQFARLALLLTTAALVCALTHLVWQATPVVVNDGVKLGQALDATTAAAGSVTAAAGKMQAIADANAAQINAAVKNANTITANLAIASRGLDLAIAEINRPCGAGESCGLIADLAKTLGTFRGTAGQLETAARHENQRIGTLDGQEQQLATDTHNALGGLADAAKSFTDLMSNKDLAASLKQTNAIITAGAGMAKEAQAAVHAFFHPTWPARVYGEVKSIVFGVGVKFIK